MHQRLTRDQFLSDIEMEFADRRVYDGNLLILSIEDALQLVERARDKSVAILGIDGFHIPDDGVGIRPDMGETLNLSARAADSWTVAVRFLEDRRETDLVFEVVLDS